MAKSGEIGLIGASPKIATEVNFESVVLRNGLVDFVGESSGASSGVAGRNGDARNSDGEAGFSGRRKGDLRAEEAVGLNGVDDVYIAW